MTITTERSASTRRRFQYGDLIVHILLLSLGILIALPIFIGFFTSFKQPTQVMTFPPQLIPEIGRWRIIGWRWK